jgi:hypothetical protein
MTFDYTALAELYPTRSYKYKAGSIKYKRFEVAAEAVRFAMEELPPEFLRGTYLEVEEQRFNGQQIRLLYESRDYPLPRKLPLSSALQDRGNKNQPESKVPKDRAAEYRELVVREASNQPRGDSGSDGPYGPPMKETSGRPLGD